MSEWSQVRLGEVMTLDVVTKEVDVNDTYDVVGVLNRGRGLLFREPMRGNETAYKTLNVIRPNQVVYSRLKAFEGAITVAPDDLGEVFASQEFPTFTCGPALMPDFFRLLTTTQPTWDALQALSTGMGGRRERVKPADFLTMRIALPSLNEQARIAGLIGSVDRQALAVIREFDRAKRALAIVRDGFPEAPERALSAVIRGIDSGRSVQTSDEKPLPGEPSVLKLSAIQLGAFSPDEAKRLDDVTGYTETHLVAEGDLLVTRASGSFDRVGYVTLARGVRPATYMPDLIWRIRPDLAECTPSFLNHLLCSPTMRAKITSSARGTASMRKINKALLGALQVPVPSLADQHDYAERCESMADVVALLDAELTRLRMFRSALLASLLSKDIEIPDSYDHLLEAAS